jgi:hypothetical protein
MGDRQARPQVIAVAMERLGGAAGAVGVAVVEAVVGVPTLPAPPQRSAAINVAESADIRSRSAARCAGSTASARITKPSSSSNETA